MLAVGDHLGGEFVEEEGRLHDAAAHRVGLRLAEPGAVGHRTEEVIDVAHAPADRLLHLREGGIRVPRVRANAARLTGAHERLGPGQLRRHRRRGDAIGEGEVLFVLVRFGHAHGIARMTAVRLVIEVGPIEMRPENPR